MPATRTEARDQALALFKAAWDAQTAPVPPLIYDGTTKQSPAPPSPWARVSFQNTVSEQRSIGGPVRDFERNALLIVQIFSAPDDGLSSADVYAKVAMDALEGKRTSGGLYFTRVSARDAGKSGAWNLTIVTAQCTYDEFKTM